MRSKVRGFYVLVNATNLPWLDHLWFLYLPAATAIFPSLNDDERTGRLWRRSRWRRRLGFRRLRRRSRRWHVASARRRLRWQRRTLSPASALRKLARLIRVLTLFVPRDASTRLDTLAIVRRDARVVGRVDTFRVRPRRDLDHARLAPFSTSRMMSSVAFLLSLATRRWSGWLHVVRVVKLEFLGQLMDQAGGWFLRIHRVCNLSCWIHSWERKNKNVLITSRDTQYWQTLLSTARYCIRRRMRDTCKYFLKGKRESERQRGRGKETRKRYHHIRDCINLLTQINIFDWLPNWIHSRRNKLTREQLCTAVPVHQLNLNVLIDYWCRQGRLTA